jgi:hypothetical protein
MVTTLGDSYGRVQGLLKKPGKEKNQSRSDSRLRKPTFEHPYL